MIFSNRRFLQGMNERIRLYNYMIPQVYLFSIVFWRKMKTPKWHFEINWPLAQDFKKDLRAFDNVSENIYLRLFIYNTSKKKMLNLELEFAKLENCSCCGQRQEVSLATTTNKANIWSFIYLLVQQTMGSS